MQIELERAHAPRRCAFCHDDLPLDEQAAGMSIAGGSRARAEAARPGPGRAGRGLGPSRARVRACVDCGVRLHAACRRELGRCPTVGCAGRADALVPARSAPRVGPGLAPWGALAPGGHRGAGDEEAPAAPGAPRPIATPWAAFVAEAAPWTELAASLDAAAWAEPPAPAPLEVGPRPGGSRPGRAVEALRPAGSSTPPSASSAA